MQLVLTRHARHRMDAYGISQSDATAALLAPDSVIGGHGGRKIAQRRINSHILRIIYEENEDVITAVTAYKAKAERYDV